MDLEEMDLEDLKYEWVLEMNNYDSYSDKRQWQKKINDLEYRIKKLEA